MTKSLRSRRSLALLAPTPLLALLTLRALPGAAADADPSAVPAPVQERRWTATGDDDWTRAIVVPARVLRGEAVSVDAGVGTDGSLHRWWTSERMACVLDSTLTRANVLGEVPGVSIAYLPPAERAGAGAVLTITSNDLLTLAPDSGAPLPPMRTPAWGWLRGITYDPELPGLAVISISGDDPLFLWNRETDAWSMVETSGLEKRGLAWDPLERGYWTLAKSGLHRFGADGVRLDRRPLELPAPTLRAIEHGAPPNLLATERGLSVFVPVLEGASPSADDLAQRWLEDLVVRVGASPLSPTTRTRYRYEHVAPAKVDLNARTSADPEALLFDCYRGPDAVTPVALEVDCTNPNAVLAVSTNEAALDLHIPSGARFASLFVTSYDGYVRITTDAGAEAGPVFASVADASVRRLSLEASAASVRWVELPRASRFEKLAYDYVGGTFRLARIDVPRDPGAPVPEPEPIEVVWR